MKLKPMITGLLAVCALFAGLVLLQPAQAEYPIPAWTSGQPIDGRHVTKTVTSVTTSSALMISTDVARMHVSCQVTSQGASGASFYWDTTSPATSTASKVVFLYDYFTPDKPATWQGPIYVMGSSTGTIVCHSYYAPEEWR